MEERKINIEKLRQGYLIFFFSAVALLNHIINEPKLATFIGYAGLLPFFLFDKKSVSFFKFLFPLYLAIFLGLIFAFTHSTRDIFRDIFYFLNPILFMIFGSVLALNLTPKSFFRLMVIIGTVLSLYYIIATLRLFGLNFMQESFKVRGNIGVGNAFAVFALLLLIFSSTYKELDFLNEFRYKWAMLLINALAVFMFNSRTYYGVLILASITLAYPYFKQNLLKYGLIALGLIAGVVALLFSFQGNELADKYLNSFAEVFFTEEVDVEQIYINYRGYEALMAFDTFMNGSMIEKITGLGFGQLIDLKMVLELAGQDWMYVPVIHNGFLYILVKTGILGILTFVLFMFRTFRLSAAEMDGQHRIIPYLLISSMLGLYFSNFFVSGFFNMEFEGLQIYFGAFLQYLIIHKEKLT